PGDDPVNRLPDARRARGDRLRQSQPRIRWARAVPRAAGDRAWPPRVPALPHQLGDPDRGSRRARLGPLAQSRLRRRPEPPVDPGAVRDLPGLGRLTDQLSVGTPSTLKPPST